MEIRDQAFKGLTACCISTTSYLAHSLKLNSLSTVIWRQKVIRSDTGPISVVNLMRSLFVFVFSKKGVKYSSCTILCCRYLWAEVGMVRCSFSMDFNPFLASQLRVLQVKWWKLGNMSPFLLKAATGPFASHPEGFFSSDWLGGSWTYLREWSGRFHE